MTPRTPPKPTRAAPQAARSEAVPRPAPSGAWATDSTQRRAISAIVPYARNARTHPASQVSLLAQILRKRGPDQPIVVDEQGIILKGHGRRLAAIEAGMTEFPVVVRTGLSEQEKREIRLEDNQVSLLAGYDPDLLRAEMSELQVMGTPLVELGFSIPEIAEYTAPKPVAGADPDAAPPVPKKITTELGDVWLLGRHRLLCGDSTRRPDVDRAMGRAKPNLMVVDPPYGVNYDPNWRQEAKLTRGSPRAVGKVANDHQADWTPAWLLFPGNIAYVWHGALHCGVVEQSLQRCGYQVRAQIVWAKTHPVVSRGHYHWQHESAFYAVKDGKDDQWRYLPEHALAAYAVKDGETADWSGDRKQSTVWFIENIKNDTGHGTQKPMECMRRPILNNSKPGDWVYDPFVGSGTTIIAAELTARKAIAIELMPGYVDVCVERWQELMGAKAKLEGDGRTFDEVRQARLKGGKHAKGNRRVAVRRVKDKPAASVAAKVAERPVRAPVRARQRPAGRKPDRQPPAVHATRDPAGQ